MKRCTWAEGSENEKRYHDEEWGVPLHEDQKLFEFLVLEGAQAGLSWSTILNKREGYRKAFYNFDIKKVANLSDTQLETLRQDERIVRNRLKILSARKNARVVLDIQKESGSFDAYLWNFVNGAPIRNGWDKMSQVPATTDISDKLSKDLKKRGMSFVGSTIMYAFMQATGMVNDHTVDCFRYKEIK